MTTLPPPLPLGYDTPPPPPRRRVRGAVVGTVLAWVVILLCAAALMVRPRWLERSGGGTPAGGAAEPVRQSIAERRSPQVEIIGRYVVGARSLAGEQAPPAKDLMGKVDEAATGPLDEFRAIMVAGELAGDREALARLDAFGRKYPIVWIHEDERALRRLYTAGPGALSDEQRELLVTNHHWFGQLALSYGLPATDARRQAAMRAAGRSMLGLMAAGFLGIAAVFTGLILLILWIVLRVKRRVVSTYRPPEPVLAGPLVETFALYLLAMVFGSQLMAWLVPSWGLWANFPLILLLPVAWGYLRLRGLSGAEVMDSLGWTRGRGVFREAGVGLLGYLAGLPIVAIGAIATVLLMKYTGRTASHPIVNQPVDQARDVLGLVLLACVWAPVIEETMFRGALFSHLRARVGWWVSAPIVSLIFAAIHPQGWVAIPVLGAIALVLAGLREWRGSSVAAMVAHAVNNAVAVTVMVVMLG